MKHINKDSRNMVDMRLIIRNYLFIFILLLLGLFGIGCKTTAPMTIVPVKQYQSITPSQEWLPSACIVFQCSEQSNRRQKRFENLLKKSCKAGRVRLFTDPAFVPDDIDILIVVVNINEPCVSVSPAAAFSEAFLSCEIECRDRQANFITKTRLSSSAHSLQSMAAVATSCLFMISTLDLSSGIERRIMKNSALGTATENLAVQIVNLATDSSQIKNILREGMREMKSTDITNYGVKLFFQKHYSHACFYLTEVCHYFPTYQPAFCYLGACQARLGQITVARDTLGKAVQLNPGTEEAAQAAAWLEACNR